MHVVWDANKWWFSPVMNRHCVLENLLDILLQSYEHLIRCPVSLQLCSWATNLEFLKCMLPSRINQPFYTWLAVLEWRLQQDSSTSLVPQSKTTDLQYSTALSHSTELSREQRKLQLHPTLNVHSHCWLTPCSLQPAHKISVFYFASQLWHSKTAIVYTRLVVPVPVLTSNTHSTTIEV